VLTTPFGLTINPEPFSPPDKGTEAQISTVYEGRSTTLFT